MVCVVSIVNYMTHSKLPKSLNYPYGGSSVAFHYTQELVSMLGYEGFIFFRICTSSDTWRWM